jgi:integrase/recombinase XerD
MILPVPPTFRRRRRRSPQLSRPPGPRRVLRSRSCLTRAALGRPLTVEEGDRLANACNTPAEKLVDWTLLDTGLRVGELCDLTSESVLSQQRQLRFKGKGSPYGKRAKIRVVPMSSRVRALLEHHFALEKSFPVKKRRAQDIVKAVADRARIWKDVSPHALRHRFATTALQKGISLPTVQKILGHDRLQTTAIYLNFTDTHI